MDLVRQEQVEYILQELDFQHVQVRCVGSGDRWPYNFRKLWLKVLRLPRQGYSLGWLRSQQNCHALG